MKVGKADGLNQQATGSISRVSSEFLAIIWGFRIQIWGQRLEAAELLHVRKWEEFGFCPWEEDNRQEEK